MKKVTIIGAGSWGIGLATVLASNGVVPLMWSIMKNDVDEINNTHKCVKYSNDIVLDKNIKATNSLEEACRYSDYLLVVIPVVFIYENLKKINEIIDKPKTFIIASKGLFKGRTISSLIHECIDPLKLKAIVALSGPSFSKWVLEKKITAVVSASKSKMAANKVSQLFNNQYFRVYTSNDIDGVEFCGAIKNVIALGSGILDGSGSGANARAALISRGLHEMVNFAKKNKIKKDTIFGLTGVGDLVLTATDLTSRNYHVGYLIGQGKSLEEAVVEVKTTAESINTLKEIYEIAKLQEVEMPIVNTLYNIIYLGAPLETEMYNIMGREVKSEWY